jgi:hypothetical protein
VAQEYTIDDKTEIILNILPSQVETLITNLRDIAANGGDVVLGGSRYINDDCDPIPGKVRIRVIPNN